MMSRDVETVHHDLQLEEDLPLHKRGWKIQRAGFAFIFLIVVTAGAGMYGDGPVSRNTLEVQSIHLEYERFFRKDADMKLLIRIPESAANSAVSFPVSYLQNFAIRYVLPEASESETNNGNVTYTFKGAGMKTIIFYLIPKNAGEVHGTITVDGQSFKISHFIYP